MTNEQVVKHLTAKLECLTRSKGFHEKCDSYNSYEGCYECDLAYKQGNIGEQIESLKIAIQALEQEPKTGHWIEYGIPRCEEQHYQCTNCDYYINFGKWGELYTKEFKYCPNCGAKMTESEG